MESLDRFAEGIGRSICLPLSPLEQLTAYQYLCSDGAYSAGWKLVGAAMVLLGLALAWATLGRKTARH